MSDTGDGPDKRAGRDEREAGAAGGVRDWSALDRRNERLAGARTRAGARAGAAAPWRARLTRGAAAGMVLAAAGAGLAAAVPAPASAGTASAGTAAWRIARHTGNGDDFTAVTAAGKSTIWAFTQGSGNAAWRRTGSSWKKFSFPGPAIAAGASSASNVWAFTFTGKAVRWTGSKWSVQHTFSGPIGGGVVLSSTNVWVFGMPSFPGSGIGSWNYNGHGWTHFSSGHGLFGGSALSASNIWAFGATSVGHYNGHTWTQTSVKKELPKPTELAGAELTGIYAQSKSSIWAVANGGREDEGGPLIILHNNGHSWKRVADNSTFGGDGSLGQVAPDGHGGLWIPMPGSGGQKSYLVHFTGGHLTAAALPVSATKIAVDSVAHVPGTTESIAGGFSHASDNPGNGVAGIVLQYGG